MSAVVLGGAGRDGDGDGDGDEAEAAAEEQEQEQFGHDEPEAFLRALLNRPVALALNDGRRCVVGKLCCVDYQGNVVLHDATECVLLTDEKTWQERYLPDVVVPSRAVQRVFALQCSRAAVHE